MSKLPLPDSGYVCSDFNFQVTLALMIFLTLTKKTKKMNQKNQKVILDAIREAADSLSGLLPDTTRHPKGRNPYAHIPKVIIATLGASYKVLDDEYFDAVMLTIRYCKENPF